MYVVKDRDYWWSLPGWTEDLDAACRFPSQEEAQMCMKARGFDLTNLSFMNEEAAYGHEKK